MARHCPLCGLYFHYASELDLHAREDHAPRHVVPEQAEHITRYLQSGRPVLGAYLKLM
jgi:hypothetical protein